MASRHEGPWRKEETFCRDGLCKGYLGGVGGAKLTIGVIASATEQVVDDGRMEADSG